MRQKAYKDEETSPWSGLSKHEPHGPDRAHAPLEDPRRSQGGSEPEKRKAGDSSPTPSWQQTQKIGDGEILTQKRHVRGNGLQLAHPFSSSQSEQKGNLHGHDT